MKRRASICHSCGKRAEWTECSAGAPPLDARCQVLSGWFAVSHWKGLESIDYYDFCCLDCLQRWVEARIPEVPETFLNAFEDK